MIRMFHANNVFKVKLIILIIYLIEI
jgi:hypothetical protein